MKMLKKNSSQTPKEEQRIVFIFGSFKELSFLYLQHISFQSILELNLIMI